MIHEGACLVSESGKHLIVQKILGEGGHLRVYEVLVTETGERKALKLYKHWQGKFDGAVWENLSLLAGIGSPDKSILWVDDIVSSSDCGFGYVTTLIPEGYIPCYRLIREEELHLSSKCNFAIDLLRAFHNTRMQGLLLFTADGTENYYVHPRTGHLLIEECERTAPVGAMPYPTIFTPKYAAPEVILGKRVLDVQTNLFSLAVILFMLFFNGHPLEGQRALQIPIMTNEMLQKVYGDHPRFVFDPEDESNRPVPAIQGKMIACWNDAPDYLKNIFIKAFSQEALRNPKARPSEKELSQVIYRYKAELTMQ